MDQEKLMGLVLAAQRGDNKAFSDLFNAYQKMVYNIALRETKNPETAADMVQETFIEVIRTIGKLQKPESFESWLKTITYHQCMDFYRKKENKHEQLLANEEDTATVFDALEEENEEFIPDKALDNDEFCQTIRSFVDKLPALQRSAIMMKYFDDLSVKEIAAVQGVSENTVLSRLYYGRKAIEAEVEAYEKKHDTKLHAIPFLPLLRFAFNEAPKAMSQKAAVAAAKAIGTATGVKITAAGAGVVGTIAAAPLAAKIGAAVAAAVIVAAVPVVDILMDDPASSTERDTSVTGDVVTNQLPSDREIVLSETYITQYATSHEDAPIFQFDYPSHWKITKNNSGEEGSAVQEVIELTNERGVVIRYVCFDRESYFVGIGRDCMTCKVMAVGSSRFIPTEEYVVDFSLQEKMAVAEIHDLTYGDVSGKYGFSEIDEYFYAVVPTSYLNKETYIGADEWRINRFSFQYDLWHAFIAQSPDGQFTASEKQEVVAILSSFREAEDAAGTTSSAEQSAVATNLVSATATTAATFAQTSVASATQSGDSTTQRHTTSTTYENHRPLVDSTFQDGEVDWGDETTTSATSTATYNYDDVTWNDGEVDWGDETTASISAITTTFYDGPGPFNDPELDWS